MYSQFVVDKLIRGGAKMPTLDIPEININTFISPEILLNPMEDNERTPKVNEPKMKTYPKLDTGTTTIKTCKLKLDNANGRKLIDFVNASVAREKDELIKMINLLKDHQTDLYNKYKQTMNLGAKGNDMDMPVYLNTIENRLADARTDIKKIDYEFKTNMYALVDGYNDDKRGLHPMDRNASSFERKKAKILQQIGKPDPIGNTAIQQMDGIVGQYVYREKEIYPCRILGVHLSKGKINLKYDYKGKLYDTTVYFSDLCIDEKPIAPAKPLPPMPSAPPAPQ